MDPNSWNPGISGVRKMTHFGTFFKREKGGQKGPKGAGDGHNGMQGHNPLAIAARPARGCSLCALLTIMAPSKKPHTTTPCALFEDPK